MTRFSFALALAGAVALAPLAQAQTPAGPPQGGFGRAGGPPGPGGMRGGPRGRPGLDPASMLLSRTGELKLTDAQVGRLAAVARRSADRRTAMRASGDSLRTALRARATDSTRRAGLREPNPAIRSMMEKAQQGAHADLRDALAVLTPDQQATAFEMIARGKNRSGGGMREGRGMRRGGGMRERGRPGMDGPQRGGRGMNGMRPQGQPPVNGVATQGRRPEYAFCAHRKTLKYAETYSQPKTERLAIVREAFCF